MIYSLVFKNLSRAKSRTVKINFGFSFLISATAQQRSFQEEGRLIATWLETGYSLRYNKRSSSLQQSFGFFFHTAALVFSFGRGVNLKYGLTILKSGNSSLACSFFTLGCTMTSSPNKHAVSPDNREKFAPWEPLPGTQLIGVVTLCLSPVCSESTTRNTSAVLRPVEAGYERMRRMVFLGSMMNTLRMVKAIPF